MTSTPQRRTEAGYSLVETLLATGLLAFILVSVSGMFIIGSQNVKSGRELTKATTIANSAMEQVMSWPFDKVYGFAGATATERTKQWDTNMANPAYVGDAADVADWGATADAWRTNVRRQLQLGRIIYKVDGAGAFPTGSTDGLVAYRDAHFLRVSVTVEWTERGKRRRQVVFEEFVL